MGEKLKARGGDDAGALVSVRDGYPNYTKNTKNLYHSQIYSHYNVGPDSLASPRNGRKVVEHE